MVASNVGARCSIRHLACNRHTSCVGISIQDVNSRRRSNIVVRDVYGSLSSRLISYQNSWFVISDYVRVNEIPAHCEQVTWLMSKRVARQDLTSNEKEYQWKQDAQSAVCYPWLEIRLTLCGVTDALWAYSDETYSNGGCKWWSWWAEDEHSKAVDCNQDPDSVVSFANCDRSPMWSRQFWLWLW